MVHTYTHTHKVFESVLNNTKKKINFQHNTYNDRITSHFNTMYNFCIVYGWCSVHRHVIHIKCFVISQAFRAFRTFSFYAWLENYINNTHIIKWVSMVVSILLRVFVHDVLHTHEHIMYEDIRDGE